MNVRCQSCETVYRIDPLKVPVEGVHARCTVCSAVIPIERVSEEQAPATDRPMTPHAQSTEDRVAQALGDAFIPAPTEDDVSLTPGGDQPHGGLDFPDQETSEEREAERTSERQAVESMPGIIMPPAEDDLSEEPVAPAAAGSLEPAPDTDTEGDNVPIEPLGPRISRPFVPPRDLAFAKPTLATPEQRVRPTAPVFRPTPGQPPQTPLVAPTPPPVSSGPAVTVPAKPFIPSVSAPMAAPPPSAAPSLTEAPAPAPAPMKAAPPKPPIEAASLAPPATPPTRPINPFLSRDPGQKARRLARALISDMIVYQPEKRQKALEDGTLADAFDEEIKKSWKEYVDQIGEELANSTSYFNDALNELLADGEKMF